MEDFGRMNGICPACFEVAELTRHHILPKRHFAVSPNSPLLILCAVCHSELEKLIPFARQKTDFYFSVAIAFLKGEKYEVTTRRHRRHRHRPNAHALLSG